MDTKKDPGKFTIRFCMSDPRQKRAVEELNAQGRLKAQFLTNAILHYVEGTAIDTTAKPAEKIDPSEPFSADSLAAIAGTLQAFRR